MSTCCQCKVKSATTNIGWCEDCVDAQTVEVGTVEVTKAFEYSQSFESAAAYHSIRVEPGTYPIVVGMSRFDCSRYVAVKFSGLVTASGYGGRENKDRIGKKDTLHAHPYKYTLRDGRFHGKVTITDDVTFEKARGV